MRSVKVTTSADRRQPLPTAASPPVSHRRAEGSLPDQPGSYSTACSPSSRIILPGRQQEGREKRKLAGTCCDSQHRVRRRGNYRGWFLRKTHNPESEAEDLTVVSMSASTNKVSSDRREELDFFYPNFKPVVLVLPMMPR